MNPADIHLKFDSHEQAQQLMLESGVWQQIANEFDTLATFDAPGYLTDEIGLIFKETGTMLTDPDEGFEYPEIAPIPGWHINMRGDVPAAIQPFVVQVNSPYRIWD